MPINTVSSSTAANAPAVRAQPKEVKQQERPKQAEQPEPVKKNATTAVKEQADAPKPRPVVNTQGQTTGRVISTSA